MSGPDAVGPDGGGDDEGLRVAEGIADKSLIAVESVSVSLLSGLSDD